MPERDHRKIARRLLGTHLERLALLKNQQSALALDTPPYTQTSEQPLPSQSSEIERPNKRQKTIKLERDVSPGLVIGHQQRDRSPRYSVDNINVGIGIDEFMEDLVLEQKQTVNLILTGKNVFITGSAGCGKTHLIEVAVKILRSQSKVVFTTAPTGQAAQHVGGVTVHNYAGWGKDVQMQSLKKVLRQVIESPAEARIQNTDVLVIDEISMVSNNFLERLNRIMQEARDSDEPFGGVQVIVCGDFFQLPPVGGLDYCFTCGEEMTKASARVDEDEEDDEEGAEARRRRRQRRQERGSQRRRIRAGVKWKCPTGCSAPVSKDHRWAFRSQVWEKAEEDGGADFSNVHLQENHRQSEPEFMNILKKIRVGQGLSPTEADLLHRCELHPEDGIRVYTHTNACDTYNDTEYKQLPGQEIRYYCYDSFKSSTLHHHLDEQGTMSVDQTLMYFDKANYPEILNLKIHMPVVLLSNLSVERGLVNGSQGLLVGFELHDETKLNNENYIGNGNQNAPEQISWRGREYRSIRHDQVKRFMRSEKNSNEVWPIVQFHNGERVAIVANCSIEQLGDRPPYALQMRTQIPLKPAWATSVHKAQGMTFDKAVVNIASAFEAGHAYVALSRTRTLRGLHLEALGQSLNIAVDKAVLDFYRTRRWAVGGFEE